MNLKNIMVSELSQSQKFPYCAITFLWYSQKDKFILTENKSVGTRLEKQEEGDTTKE